MAIANIRFPDILAPVLTISNRGQDNNSNSRINTYN